MKRLLIVALFIRALSCDSWATSDSNLLVGVAGALAPGGRIEVHPDVTQVTSADGLTTWRIRPTSYGYDAWSGATRTEIRTTAAGTRITRPAESVPGLEVKPIERGYVVRTVRPSRLYREVRRTDRGYTTHDR